MADPVRLDGGERLVILGGGILAALAISGINPVLPAIDAALAHGPTDRLLVKQLVGAVGLAMVVGAPIAGYLLNRLGLGRMLVLAGIAYALFGTAGLYVGDLRILLATRLIVGLAAAAIQVTSLALINTRFDGPARARWMGLHISMAMFGTIALNPVAGLLGNIGWRWPFLIYAAGLLLLFAARARATPGAGGRSRIPPPAGGGIGWFPLYFLPLAICVGSLVFLPVVYGPFLLKQQGLTRPFAISLVLTADSLIGAAMALLYGKARARLSAGAAFAVSFAFVAAGTALVASAHDLVGIVAGLMMYGLGVGWLVPNLMTALGERLAPEHQARGAGWVKAAHYAAAPLSVAVADPIARHAGPTGVMAVTAGLALALLLAIALTRPFRRPRRADHGVRHG